jgi:competence transcription factor ComK
LTDKIRQISQFWRIFTKVMFTNGKVIFDVSLALIKEHMSNSPIFYKKVQKG